MSVSLALDLGTTSTAAVAVDRHGTLQEVVRRDHRAHRQGLSPGHAEQSVEAHWETAIDVLRELSERVNEAPVCLGLTGQMHSVLAVDHNADPCGPLVTWQDRRAVEPMGGLAVNYLEALLDRCDESDLFNTGCRLSPGYAAVSLSVLQQRGQLGDQVAGMALLADWIASQLTGAAITTERSNAASTGVYDLRHDQWCDRLIDVCGLPRSWFPPVVDSGTQIGTLRPDIAARTGLPAGLTVIVPIGDNQASVLGSVPQGEPAIQITIGTGGQINWPVDEFVRTDGMDTRPFPPNRYLLVGAGLAGGDAFAWVHRTMHSWLEAHGANVDDADLYSRLIQLAKNVTAGADGLRCEPFFRGTRREPGRRAVFDGIGSDNFSPGHVARSVLEGIASSFHRVWEGAEGRRPEVQRIIGCGNGIERNPLLATILSQTFDLPLLQPRHPEAAAYGAALLAGVGVGLWPDLEAAGGGIELTDIEGAGA